MLDRTFTECLIRPADLPPTREDFQVIGTFNPGVVDLGNDDVMLLVRVCERAIETRDGQTALPRYENGAIVVDWIHNDAYDTRDPRYVVSNKTGLYSLTFVSHLRAVRLEGGREVAQIDAPLVEPNAPWESYGVEDPRISKIDEQFVITYVAVSPHGAGIAMATTRDFMTYDRHGIIFPPENKDAMLFPEQINGRYWALHRPNPNAWYAPPEMWIASSMDMKQWGGHQPFYSGEGTWQSGRIGGGTPPLRTEHGWLTIYHGNDKQHGEQRIGRYVGAALLMDLNDPARIVARSEGPVIVPEKEFEKSGFVGDVVFPTGLVERGDEYWIYYGAADEFVGVAGVKKTDLINAMTPCG